MKFSQLDQVFPYNVFPNFFEKSKHKNNTKVIPNKECIDSYSCAFARASLF